MSSAPIPPMGGGRGLPPRAADAPDARDLQRGLARLGAATLAIQEDAAHNPAPPTPTNFRRRLAEAFDEGGGGGGGDGESALDESAPPAARTPVRIATGDRASNGAPIDSNFTPSVVRQLRTDRDARQAQPVAESIGTVRKIGGGPVRPALPAVNEGEEIVTDLATLLGKKRAIPPQQAPARQPVQEAQQPQQRQAPQQGPSLANKGLSDVQRMFRRR